ncbi:MAG: lasso peptide biosynthesis B2 protein [Gammaproteobacteria bacterium]
MSRYFLSQHSFACEAAGHAVFLDLKRDKYTAVAPEDLWVLRTAVQGWPAIQPTPPDDTTATAIATAPAGTKQSRITTDVVDMLIKEGLVTADASLGKAATPPHLDAPTNTFLANPRLWPQLTTRDLRNFISVWAATTLMLRTLPISWIANRARRRKERLAASAPPFDPRKAQLLTTIHFVLQPAFYSAKDACLRNSLTLVEFLARYQIYPTWAFGVRMEPFAAHSWVQQGPVLFTDPIDHVKTFTPIMLI